MGSNVRSRRFIAGAAGLAMLAGLVAPIAAAPAAQATEPTTTSRIGGADRFATAANAAKDAFPNGADAVVLATGIDFPDALAASGLAGAVTAPVLLTLADDIPNATSAALTSLDPADVYVIGGEKVISANVVQALESAGYDVTRVSGADRFATAAAAGRQVDLTDDSNPVTTDGVGTVDGERTAIIVNGLGFPDAVSGSQIAYAGRFPILLVTPSVAPQATKDALDLLNITNIIVVGGTAVVSEAVVQELIADTDVATSVRLSGDNRYSTNTAVVSWAIEKLAFKAPLVYLATGAKFPDALGGSALAGSVKRPLLLTDPTTLVAPLRAFVLANAAAIDALVALGGTSAVSNDLLAEVAEVAVLDTAEILTLSPPESEVRPFSASFATNEGRREYTASGLVAGTTYDVALLDPTVVGKSGGRTTISAWTLSDDATTSIESVNGTPVNAAGSSQETQQTTGVATSEGKIVFTVDATTADSIIPVIWEDSGTDDGMLNTSKDIPVEPFGVGGRTSWLPTEAANGFKDDLVVLEVNRENGYFIAAGDSQQGEGNRVTYFYDAADNLRFGATIPTLEEFNGFLSSRDVFDVTYSRTGASTFKLLTDDIPDITNVAASLSGNAQVTVSWTASSQPDVIYTVYRDADHNGLYEPFNDQGTPNDVTDDTGDPEVSATGTSVRRTFTESPPVVGRQQYIVRPQGGFTKVYDTREDVAPDPFTGRRNITFLTNEVRPSVDPFGFTNGSVVSVDNQSDGRSGPGDQWLLHFDRPVTIGANASITVAATGQVAPNDPATETRFVIPRAANKSTWSLIGTSTVAITLGSDVPGLGSIVYPTTTAADGTQNNIRALSGISANGAALTAASLKDRSLEHNGPELMLESSTCRTGGDRCQIAFNEEVSGANQTTSYSYTQDGPAASGPPTRSLQSAALGSDNRTVTLVFNGATDLGADDHIGPTASPQVSEVEDLEDDASWAQARFDFVT